MIRKKKSFISISSVFDIEKFEKNKIDAWNKFHDFHIELQFLSYFFKDSKNYSIRWFHTYSWCRRSDHLTNFWSCTKKYTKSFELRIEIILKISSRYSKIYLLLLILEIWIIRFNIWNSLDPSFWILINFIFNYFHKKYFSVFLIEIKKNEFSYFYEIWWCFIIYKV